MINHDVFLVYPHFFKMYILALRSSFLPSFLPSFILICITVVWISSTPDAYSVFRGGSSYPFSGLRSLYHRLYSEWTSSGPRSTGRVTSETRVGSRGEGRE